LVQQTIHNQFSFSDDRGTVAESSQTSLQCNPIFRFALRARILTVQVGRQEAVEKRILILATVALLWFSWSWALGAQEPQAQQSQGQRNKQHTPKDGHH
jgi:hypothetical protein